jgi:hypothetical protein
MIVHGDIFAPEVQAVVRAAGPYPLIIADPPYLSEERGYPGYSKQYPAKSKFKRRTNVSMLGSWIGWRLTSRLIRDRSDWRCEPFSYGFEDHGEPID